MAEKLRAAGIDGDGRGAHQAPLLDPPEAASGSASTSSRSTTSWRCASSSRRCPTATPPSASLHNIWRPVPGPDQGLHRHAAAERLPVAPHVGDRRRGPAVRGADPHPRDAPRRRGGDRRPLEVQGGPHRRRQGRPRLRLAARSCSSGSRRSRTPTSSSNSLKLDLYPEEVYCFTPKGEVRMLPAGRLADRLRLRDPHRGRPPVRRRARQRQDGAAALQAEERRHRRDRHLRPATSRAATGSASRSRTRPRRRSATTSTPRRSSRPSRSAASTSSASCAATTSR